MGDFVMPKHTGLLREFTIPLKVCYEKRNENDGWIPNGHATRKEEGFAYSIYKEYNRLGFEKTPKDDNSDYTKDAQIPLYLGFIEGRGHNNTEKRITPQGIKMYEAIESNNVNAQYELLIDAFERKTFGRNNQGFPSADSDVEVPNVLLISSILLDGITRQEFYYVIFLMHTKGWDLAHAVAEIIYLRKSGHNTPELPTIFTDCKLIPLFISMNFLTEDVQKRLHIAKNVYDDFAKRILCLRTKNDEVVNRAVNQYCDEELKDDFIPRQTIYYGAPGTGKSHIVKKQTEGESVVRTTFHPDSDYSTFVGCYKPTTKPCPMYTSYGEKAVTIKDATGKELTENRIVYEFVDQAFLQAYIKAWKFYAQATEGSDPKKQYLIIEEINRGNCAQIFGDLFQLLDRNGRGFSDYYIHADNDLKRHIYQKFQDNGVTFSEYHQKAIDAVYPKEEESVALRVLSGEILLLPNNLYIWATMNTSDQSLFPIDSAFKRRWDWEYEPIKYKNINWVIDIEGSKYLWTSFQREINKRIFDTTNSEDKMLGDYFVNPTDGVITEKILLNKILFYLWNDVCKDGEGDIFKTTDNEEVTFSDLHSDGGKDMLIAMMKYLKVQEIVEDTDAKEPSKRKNPKYSINNSKDSYSTPETVCHVIQEYAEQNLGKSVQEMIDLWNGISERNDCLVDSWAPSPNDKQPFANKRRSEIKWGDKSVWVTRGWTEEIFQTFIRNAKEQLGVIIEKVE